MNFANIVNSFLGSVNGVVDGKPRIYNIDRDTYTLGYTEINTQATTAFARTKTHKGWFAGATDIQNGDLLLDRADGAHYLVMSVKQEFAGGCATYIDGTLFYTNATCSIERFTDSGKDFFGRDIVSAPEQVVAEAWIMVNPMSVSIMEQQDQILADDKIKVAIQRKFNVEEQDRLVTSLGENYKVISVDRASLEGIDILYVDKDIR